MNKLIIANWGVGNQGKSASVKCVFDLLSQKYPATVLINDGDIKAIIEIGPVKVGIESQGDPNSRLVESINDFISNRCEIIVCACRTSGDTTNKVASLKNQGFDIIWTQNDRSDNESLHAALYNLYAERIERIINLHINRPLPDNPPMKSGHTTIPGLYESAQFRRADYARASDGK